MLSVIENYFSTPEDKTIIESYRLNGFNFYQYKRVIPNAPNNEGLRSLAEKLFNIYSHFARELGQEIPTVKMDSKKKLISRMFSIVKKKTPFLFDNLYDDYRRKLKLLDMKETRLNLNAYCLYRMPDFDLDSFNIGFGFARIGKSTLASQLQKRYYCFRNMIPLNEINEWMIKNKILKKTVLHTQKQNSKELINKCREQFIWIDEGYLFGDRRNAMKDQLVQLTHDVNTGADNNNVFIMLIQDLSDLDLRFVNKANSMIGITERSFGLLFSRAKNFSFIKDSYNFEYIQKHQNLFNSYDKGLDTLKKLPSYTYHEEWPELQTFKEDELGIPERDNAGNKIITWIDDVFKQYKADKQYWKQETTELDISLEKAVKNRDLQFIERYG